jgi:hypothetical protein
MQTGRSIDVTLRHGVTLFRTPMNRGLTRYAAEGQPAAVALGTNTRRRAAQGGARIDVE